MYCTVRLHIHHVPAIGAGHQSDAPPRHPPCGQGAPHGQVQVPKRTGMNASLPTPTGPRVRWDRRARRTGGHVHKEGRGGTEAKKTNTFSFPTPSASGVGGAGGSTTPRHGGKPRPPWALPSRPQPPRHRKKINRKGMREQQHIKEALCCARRHTLAGLPRLQKRHLPHPTPHRPMTCRQTDRQRQTQTNTHANKTNTHAT